MQFSGDVVGIVIVAAGGPSAPGVSPLVACQDPGGKTKASTKYLPLGL